MCALRPRRDGSDSTTRADCTIGLPQARVGPLLGQLRQPTREAFHAGELDDRGAGLDGLRLELVGMMEIRGGEPLIDSIGIAMLPVEEVAVDDPAESRRRRSSRTRGPRRVMRID